MDQVKIYKITKEVFVKEIEKWDDKSHSAHIKRDIQREVASENVAIELEQMYEGFLEKLFG
jgi:hypothetical protein